MSDAFDPNTQPPPDQASGPPPGAPPPGLNPFDPFPKPPQRMAQLDPEEQRWKQRTQPPEPAPPKPEPPRLQQPQPAQPQQPQPAQGKLPPPWPPKWVPNRRQFYVPSSGNRGPGMWGTPRQFPMQPPIWQVPDILMGIGQQLSQFGPPGIAMLAMGMNRYTKAFMDGLHKGQKEFARQHKQHAKRHAMQLDQHTQRMLDDYRTAFSQSSGPDDQGNLEQKIGEIARGYNDQRMLNELQNNGIQGVINQLNWFDAKHSDLRASRGVQDEADERLQASNPFMLNPVDDMGVPTQRQKPPFKVTPDTLTTPPVPMRLAGAMPTPDTTRSGEQNRPKMGAGRDQELYDAGAYHPAPKMPWPDQPPVGADEDPVEGPLNDEEGYPIEPPSTAEKPRPIQPDTSKEPTPPPKPPAEPETDEDFEKQIEREQFDEQRRKAGEQSASAGKPVRLAQADTGTATDAPPPGARAAEPKPGDQGPGDPFGQAETRIEMKERGILPGYRDQAAAPKLPTPEELHAAKQKEIDEQDKQTPLQMTPALTAIKQKNPNADLRMVDGMARRKFLGQLSASQEKALEKAGLLDDINQRANELEAVADDILGRAQRGELKPEDALNEIRTKLGPRMAGDVESILQGMGTGRANLSKPPFDKVLSLARAVDPTLTQATLDTRKRTMGMFLGTSGGAQIVVGAVHAQQVGEDLRKELTNMPDYWRMKAYELARKVNRQLADRQFPDVAKKMADIEAGGKTFVAEAQKVFAAGRPTQLERMLMAEEINWDEPTRAIELLEKHQKYLQWRLEDNKRIWDVGTKGMPGADKLFDQMTGQDPAVKRTWGQTKAATQPIEQREGGWGDKPPADFQDVPGHPGVKFRQVQ